MPKNKRVNPDIDAPLTSHEEHAGGSPKKKKRRRSKSQEEKEIIASPVLSQSLSSISSPGLSPSKKKKKKKKKEKKEVDARLNGVVEMGEEVLREKTKKKTAAVEEEEIQDEEVGSKKAKKKKSNKEEAMTPKKKMGKTQQDEMERSLEEEEEQGEDTSVKKKTKKKAKQKASPSYPASTATPTRKDWKMEELEDEWKIDIEEEEIDTEIKNDNDWPEEATEELLNRIASQLPPPHRDTRACRVSLKSVDWEKAAIPGRFPDACMEHFMSYYKKICHFKSLTTILEEIKQLVASGLDDRRNHPLRPIHRFLQEFITPEIRDEAQRTGKNVFSIGHKAWKDLPEDQKGVYLHRYKEELSKIKPGLSSNKPAVELPKPPYQFCWETQGQAGPNVKKRSYYASLAPHKQVPYIRRSLEDMMKYESNLQDYLASHPEYQPPSHHPVSKNDLKTYLDAHGCPAIPACRPALVFYKEASASGKLSSLPGLQRMAEAMKMYRKLSVLEKANYKKKFEQELEQFEEDLKEWSNGQDEVTLYALKKYRELVTFIMPKKQKKTHHVKAEDIFHHKATAATSCPKFLGEPSRPPSGPYYLFTSKFRASVSETLSGPGIQRALREGWKNLGKEEKEVYITRCRTLHKQYEGEVKEYVQQLDPKTRRLFLGFNRVPLFRFFNNRDVFAEEFPNSERYPVYVKGEHPSSSPTKLSHYYNSDHEDNKQEEEDKGEEQEEEEEEKGISLASKTAKAKKPLTPLLFSSLDLSHTNKGSKTKPAPTTTSPKKSTAQQLIHSSSEEESVDEEVDVTSPWHLPAPAAPITKAKKKAHASVAAANASKKSKAPPAPPPPESESEESEDEEDVTPAWHSPAVPTATTQAKKQQKPQLQRQHKNRQDDSSSSGFSDSDSSS